MSTLSITDKLPSSQFSGNVHLILTLNLIGNSRLIILSVRPCYKRHQGCFLLWVAEKHWCSKQCVSCAPRCMRSSHQASNSKPHAILHKENRQHGTEPLKRLRECLVRVYAEVGYHCAQQSLDPGKHNLELCVSVVTQSSACVCTQK